MYISEETAQLILDALCWCNMDWMDSLGWAQTEKDKTEMARADFIRFCEDRGIKGVERKIRIKTPVEKAVED